MCQAGLSVSTQCLSSMPQILQSYRGGNYSDRGGALRAALKRVASLPRLDILERLHELHALTGANSAMPSLCASGPSPERPWRVVLTLMYPTACCRFGLMGRQ